MLTPSVKRSIINHTYLQRLHTMHNCSLQIESAIQYMLENDTIALCVTHHKMHALWWSLKWIYLAVRLHPFMQYESMIEQCHMELRSLHSEEYFQT